MYLIRKPNGNPSLGSVRHAVKQIKPSRAVAALEAQNPVNIRKFKNSFLTLSYN
jgi:hypothetical protein